MKKLSLLILFMMAIKFVTGQQSYPTMDLNSRNEPIQKVILSGRFVQYQSSKTDSKTHMVYESISDWMPDTLAVMKNELWRSFGDDRFILNVNDVFSYYKCYGCFSGNPEKWHEKIKYTFTHGVMTDSIVIAYPSTALASDTLPPVKK